MLVSAITKLYVPDSKLHGANMGLTWVPSAPYGPHAGPMNLAIWGSLVVKMRGFAYSDGIGYGR